MTAYVVPTRLHKPIRDDLASIVGGGFWHTTEAHRDPALRPKVEALCEYVAEGSDDERIVVAVRVPIAADDQNAEEARALCFTALLGALVALEPRVALVVFEERRYQAQRNRDAATITRARGISAAMRVLPVFPASPADESLLWLPDVISFASYQQHGGTPWSSYAGAFESRVQYVRVTA